MKYSRQQMLNNECTHRQYYAQFVNEGTKHTVLTYIGKEAIMNSTDEHLNDIPLSKWDNLQISIGGSFSHTVCVAKEAARQIQEELT